MVRKTWLTKTEKKCLQITDQKLEQRDYLKKN